MRFLAPLAAKYLALITHLPGVAKFVGHFDWPTFILLMFFGAGTTALAIHLWGHMVPIPEGRFNLIAKAGAHLRNGRAKLLTSIGWVPVFVAISAVFASGMLGTGSVLNMSNGPNIFGAVDHVYVDRERDGFCDHIKGVHLTIFLASKDGSFAAGGRKFDDEHPYNVFFSADQVRTDIKEGNIISIALGEDNRGVAIKSASQLASAQ